MIMVDIIQITSFYSKFDTINNILLYGN